MDEQPDNDVDGLRALKQLACVFHTEHRFRYHNSTVHPALRAQPLTIRVRHIDVVLPANLIDKRELPIVFRRCTMS